MLNQYLQLLEIFFLLKYLYFLAAVGNVGLNFIFIPILGATGAAIASVITQVLTAIIIPMFIKPLRANGIMMLEGIMLKGVFSKKKRKQEEVDLENNEDETN